MKSLPKLVYKDKNGFYEAGCEKFISCSARILAKDIFLSTLDTIFVCSMISSPGEIVPAYFPHTIKVTKVLDPNLGIIFIDGTDFLTECFEAAPPPGTEVYSRTDYTINNPGDGSGENSIAITGTDGIDQIWIKPSSAETGSFIGYTDGGDEILVAENLSANVWKPINIQLSTPITIYLKEIFSLTQVAVFKITLP